MIRAMCLMILILSGAARAQVAIDAMKFGTAVEKNEVVGEGASFAVSTEKVFCWIKVLNAENRTLTAKWYLNDVWVSDVPLEISSNAMRTYSSKTIAGNKGTWKVDIVSDNGDVLQSGTFTTQ